jgi:DNA-binding PadR family transcriptional regulator
VKEDRIWRHPTLTPLELQILLALSCEDLRGAEILRAISREMERLKTIWSQTPYVAVHRLISMGLIRVSVANQEENSDGPTKRFLQLTASGRRAAQSELRRMAILVETALQKGMLQGAIHVEELETSEVAKGE